LSDGAVPVDALASKEAMTHHVLAKQKKDDCQGDYKHEPLRANISETV
jgi:hypothetical protein